MGPLVPNIRRYLSFKDAIVILLSVILSICLGAGVFFYLERDVLINDNGKQYAVRTMKATVKDVLAQNGISIESYDYISLPLDMELDRRKANRIDIKRAVPVTILADGREIGMMTYRDTVGEVIGDSPVALDADDVLDGVSLEDCVTAGMNIKIVRVREEIDRQIIPIPFETVKSENSHMDKGTEKVVEEGKEGRREKLFRVVLRDGIETERELIKDNIILEPVNRIIEYGTILNHKTARGDIIRYKKVLNMRATAYTSSFKDTGKHPDHPEFGITYTGLKARKGIIAVDPKVIPLGTKVYVEVAGKTPDYGYALAADIGGAIKGNLIDLYFDDQETVDRWGCKQVKVYILLDQ